EIAVADEVGLDGFAAAGEGRDAQQAAGGGGQIAWPIGGAALDACEVGRGVVERAVAQAGQDINIVGQEVPRAAAAVVAIASRADGELVVVKNRNDPETVGGGVAAHAADEDF